MSNGIIPIEYQIDSPTLDYMVAMRRFKYAKELNKQIPDKNKRYIEKGSYLAMIVPGKIYKDEKGYFILVKDLIKWDGYPKYKDMIDAEDTNFKLKLKENREVKQ